jgi:hypothetical protein
MPSVLRDTNTANVREKFRIRNESSAKKENSCIVFIGVVFSKYKKKSGTSIFRNKKILRNNLIICIPPRQGMGRRGRILKAGNE